MCAGVLYLYQGEVVRAYFTHPRAALPVLRRCGDVQLVAWGRRQGQNGSLPLGGWARLDAIHGGRWDRFFPRPVKIPVQGFAESDIAGRVRWYDLQKNQVLQGLLARDGGVHRVYVVTIDPVLDDAVHARWPRILFR